MILSWPKNEKSQFPEKLADLFKQCYKLLSNQLEL